MEVRTFVVGLGDGYSSAFKALDDKVRQELGKQIRIYSVQDTFYKSTKKISRPDEDNHIARVIVYDTNY